MDGSGKEFNFVLVFAGLKKPNRRIEDALFKAGCSDATLGFRNRVGYLEFDREALDFMEAFLSALTDVKKAKIGAQVIRVEPGDFVNASEISRRSGLSREYVRLLSQGKRGKGGFPIPLSGITGKSLVWSWTEVAEWLVNNNKTIDKSSVQKAVVIRDVNAALEYLNSPETFRRRQELLDNIRRRAIEVERRV